MPQISKDNRPATCDHKPSNLPEQRACHPLFPGAKNNGGNSHDAHSRWLAAFNLPPDGPFGHHGAPHAPQHRGGKEDHEPNNLQEQCTSHPLFPGDKNNGGNSHDAHSRWLAAFDLPPDGPFGHPGAPHTPQHAQGGKDSHQEGDGTRNLDDAHSCWLAAFNLPRDGSFGRAGSFGRDGNQERTWPPFWPQSYSPGHHLHSGSNAPGQWGNSQNAEWGASCCQSHHHGAVLASWTGFNPYGGSARFGGGPRLPVYWQK